MATKVKRRRTMKQADVDARAIGIVRGEQQNWEVATAFITDRVSFKMRQLIRICRKNYYGIFDQPYDMFTLLEKIWYPLTEIQVEAVVKNIDLDQKDLNFRSKTPNGYAITDITRSHVKNKLSGIYFGEKLDKFERDLSIDGTAVWKTYEEAGKLIIQPIDLLNIYIDPTSPSIQEAYRFTERSLLSPEQIAGMTGWYNTGLDVLFKDVPMGIPRVDPYWNSSSPGILSNVKLWDCYETWGKIPKSLITHDMADDDEEVEGHIVVSGIDANRPTCHLIEQNFKTDEEGNPLKPYEEAWYTRVPNRWYGRGVAEKVMTLQVYANIVFNVRINRSRVSQLGLFKIKKGAGVTPQMLARLPSNGAVVLNNMDDLQQFVVQEVGATSYKDEDVINTLSERLTNAFEVATGEALPSSTPATNAVLQSQAAKSGFNIIKDGVGKFLERWMDRHALPIMAKELTADEIVRISANEESFKELIDRVLMFQAEKALDDTFANGYIPSEQEMLAALDSARSKMSKNDMFVKLVRKIITEGLETEFYVTNEELDISVTIANLMTMLQAAPQYQEPIVKEAFDLMGLPTPKMPAQLPQPQQPGQGLPQAGAPQAPGIPGAPQQPQIPGQGLPVGRLSPQQQQGIATQALTR